VIALDADEFLTPTWQNSADWRNALEAPSGTVFAFDWVNVLPDCRSGYVPPQRIPLAFIDDGSEHAGDRIHSTRIPIGDSAQVHDMSEVKILHLQFTDWRRMKSKQRWYQVWEALNHANKRPVQIYRQYHRMDAFPRPEILPLDVGWIDQYRAWGIDLTPRHDPSPPWWDREVLEWIVEHGGERFRRLDIWDVSWEEIARHLDRSIEPDALLDPRRRIDHSVLRWLAKTQDSVETARTRWIQRMLILIGW
jgi:hypothetical protein